MGGTDIREDTNRWVQDSLQVLHFIGPGDSGFKDAQCVMILHLPDGQGHSNLRVIAGGVFCNLEVGRQQLVQPFLHDGFSVAARDADERNVE